MPESPQPRVNPVDMARRQVEAATRHLDMDPGIL